MVKPARILPVLCALILVLAAAPLGAHEEETRVAAPARVLGTISFPTSAKSAEAQQAFIRGMLLLHLFEYPFARDEFLTAQRIEPDFALAYWGEAMTYTHPVWDQQDAEAGRAALRKLAPTPELRLAKAPGAREQAFLGAIEALYGQGSKAERDRAYARAMERMAARFPADHEVQLFHALALLGVYAGVRDVPAYMQVGAIAQAVFCANPQHPGAAHYLIHAVDDPDHAVLGLDAARALARMAPDAGHSLHMTSHIFTALGMWDDMVQANEAAVAVAGRALGALQLLAALRLSAAGADRAGADPADGRARAGAGGTRGTRESPGTRLRQFAARVRGADVDALPGGDRGVGRRARALGLRCG
jgi:hypothetical protein